MMVAEEGEEGDGIEVQTRTEEGEAREGGCEIVVPLAIGAGRRRTSRRSRRSTPPLPPSSPCPREAARPLTSPPRVSSRTSSSSMTSASTASGCWHLGGTGQ